VVPSPQPPGSPVPGPRPPGALEADLATRVLDPFWRGLVGYRVLAWGYAAALVAVNHPYYRSPGGAVLALVLMAVWTVVTAVGYLRPWRAFGQGRLALLDIVVTLVAVAGTRVVDTPDRIAHGAPVLTTVWSAGPVIAVALAYGVLPGLAGALLVQAAVLLVRGHLGAAEATDLLLMVATALAVGYAATVLRRSSDRLRQAIELRAALAERERLARSIHDGVLQVLAQVRRRGTELGGPAAELGSLAGEQEVALRTLIVTGPPEQRPLGQEEVTARLAALATPLVTVSTPATPVLLPAHTGGELVAAVAAALANVRVHVGREAPAWVLLEDLGEQVVVSVRDDGPGIPAGRLAAAEAEGRLGVSRSIQGRIESVGGTARCESGPGLGCEWTFEIPVRRAPAGRRR
jgi:signal transduction histidine kinase